MSSRRTYGAGSISRRGRDSWRIRFYGPPDATGRRRRHAETVHGTRRAPERALRNRQTALENGGSVPQRSDGRW